MDLLDGFKKRVLSAIINLDKGFIVYGRSSNGRTQHSECCNRGSNPCFPAIHVLQKPEWANVNMSECEYFIAPEKSLL